MIINRRFVTKVLLYALVVIGIIVLQTNIFNNWKIFATKPNLIISLVIASCIIDGEKCGAIVGLVSGFVVDVGFGSPFMMSGLYYFFAAYILGRIAKIYFKKSLITMMIALLIAGFGKEIINVFYVNTIWDNFSIAGTALHYILPEYLYTAACAPLVYFFVKYTVGRYSYITNYIE